MSNEEVFLWSNATTPSIGTDTNVWRGSSFKAKITGVLMKKIIVPIDTPSNIEKIQLWETNEVTGVLKDLVAEGVPIQDTNRAYLGVNIYLDSGKVYTAMCKYSRPNIGNYYFGSSGIPTENRYFEALLMIARNTNSNFAKVEATDPKAGTSILGNSYEVQFGFEIVGLNKTLISLSSGEYKTFENSSWSTVSTLPPTREIFETKGIEDLSTVSQSAWELLSKEYSTVELVTYVPEGNTVSNFSNTYEALEMNLQLKGLPVGQMVFSKKTVLYGNLTQAIVNQLDEGLPNGIIRLLVSFDRGETWRIYSEGLWKEVYPLTEASFIEKGMTMSDLALLGKDDFRLGANDEICFAYYIEEDIRRNDSAKLTDLSLKQKTTINTVEISDASLYILNTASTINISLTGTELSGKISDIDLGKVKYRVLLNGNPYYPADGKFTDFQPTPLDISLRIDGKSVLIDKSNTLIVEFEDYWGSTDFWSTTFIGTYSGLIFKDPTGEAYATEIGQVLKYLDIGTLIAGQKSEEFEIHLENSYGYDVKNPKIVSQTKNEGVVFELSKSNSPFNSQEELAWDGEFKNGESLKFYLRIVTSVKTPPVMGGAFELIVNADKV